jgi:hypothetical protein
MRTNIDVQLYARFTAYFTLKRIVRMNLLNSVTEILAALDYSHIPLLLAISS